MASEDSAKTFKIKAGLAQMLKGGYTPTSLNSNQS